MIVNGRAITKDILKSVRDDVANRSHVPVVRAITVQPSAATRSYLATKKRKAKEAGMQLEIVELSADIDTDAVIAAVTEEGADAMLVQLPLPDALDTDRILSSIPLEKDADVLSKRAHEVFESADTNALLPPVVDAVREVLIREHIDVAGTQVVVVGRGWLVGEPCTVWLRSQGAKVTVVTRESGDFSVLKDADIIVSGAGSPGLIQPEHISAGVVLIDAGTSESGGAIVGDADPACADVASVFTPVPGGIGPIAVACLFRNVSILAHRDRLQGS